MGEGELDKDENGDNTINDDNDESKLASRAEGGDARSSDRRGLQINHDDEQIELSEDSAVDWKMAGGKKK